MLRSILRCPALLLLKARHLLAPRDLRPCKYCKEPPSLEIAPTLADPPRPHSVLILCAHCGGCPCCHGKGFSSKEGSLNLALHAAVFRWNMAQILICENHEGVISDLPQSIARRERKRNDK